MVTAPGSSSSSSSSSMPSKKSGRRGSKPSKSGSSAKAAVQLPLPLRAVTLNAAALFPPAPPDGDQHYGERSELRVEEHELHSDAPSQSWITALGGVLTLTESHAWIQPVLTREQKGGTQHILALSHPTRRRSQVGAVS